MTKTALGGTLQRGLQANGLCSNYPYGTTIIAGSSWASGLGILSAPDGATFDVKSNWDGSSCVRGEDSSDTIDRWGLDYQCTQLAARAADIEWNEPPAAWGAAGWNGNAYNMFDVAPNLPNPLVSVANGSGLLPNPGDILVWGATSFDPTGHVAVVERVDTVNQVVWFVNQNSTYAEYGMPYTGTTVDPNEGFGLPLRGWIDNPRPARGVVARVDGTSGYTMDGWGGVHPFGGAPQVSITGYWPNWDIARGIALRPDQQSGYVLDGFGGLHPFGGAPNITNVSGYWPGWDITRGVALRSDGTSGYVLDAYGGLHAFGGAPAISVSAYWAGRDLARGIVLLPNGVSGYVLDAFGGLHAFGGAPAVTVSGYWPNWDIARGVALDSTGGTAPVSGWTLDGWGGIHAFGGAPTVTWLSKAFTPGVDAARGVAFSALYARGVVASGAAAPAAFALSGPARGMALRADGSNGYTVDGWGDVASFGGAPAATNISATWPAWDIVRAIVLRPDGVSGYVVDAWGSFHPFGTAPALVGPTYTQGQDTVRGVILRSDGVSGYVLDDQGRIWPFGGAPAAAPSQTWSGDTARGFALRSDGASGYVVDAYGNVWGFGGAPAIQGLPAWSSDTARGIALLTDTSGYVLDDQGGVHPFGGAPSVAGEPIYSGVDVARAIVLAPTTATGAVRGFVLYSNGSVSSFTSAVAQRAQRP